MSFSGFADEIESTEKIENAPFWPAIGLAQFQIEYRLPADYRQELLKNRLRLAMIWANDELDAFRKAQIAAGFTSLSAVPGDCLGDEKRLDILYVRAVSAKAKAMLLADYKTMMRKSDAQSDAKESEDTADNWHQVAMESLCTIKGTQAVHAEAL